MGINTLLAVDLPNAAGRDICVSSSTYLYFLFFTPSVLLLLPLSSYCIALILDPFFSAQFLLEGYIIIL